MTSVLVGHPFLGEGGVHIVGASWLLAGMERWRGDENIDVYEQGD